MITKLVEKKAKIGVIGLGYVGLPIALEFARQYAVVGFDIKPERIELLKQHIDPSNELDAKQFEGCDILFSCNEADLSEVSFFIIAVPTPIDQHTYPDLIPLLKASETVGRSLKSGDYVIYESTVYPGCTEDDCIPILEQTSGLSFKFDFKVGYSPERINPGDTEHSLTRITKVVSGCDAESLEVIAQVYSSIIKAGVYRATSIKVAEAAKIIENTQRDVNIALMNELSIIFNHLAINTYDVLDAAGTKWNFLKFSPGLVGGHCIGVDPYYLLHKAKALGYHAQIIGAGRAINDGMAEYVASTIVKKLVANGIASTKARALIMGITFKENVTDIRNTKVVDIYTELKQYGLQVDVYDPVADAHEVLHEYGMTLSAKPSAEYDVVILAVNHSQFALLSEDYFASIIKQNGLMVDIKGVFRNKISKLSYWSL